MNITTRGPAFSATFTFTLVLTLFAAAAAAHAQEATTGPADPEPLTPPAAHVRAGVQVRTSLATGREGWGQDIINVRPTVIGQAHPKLKVEAALEFDRHVIPVPPQSAPGLIDRDVVALLETSHAVLLDAVVKLELHRTFNLWVGRFRPPADRSSLSDVYGINAWNYPDLVHQYPSLAACRGSGCVANDAEARASMARDEISDPAEQSRRISRALVTTRR